MDINHTINRNRIAAINKTHSDKLLFLSEFEKNVIIGKQLDYERARSLYYNHHTHLSTPLVSIKSNITVLSNDFYYYNRIVVSIY